MRNKVAFILIIANLCMFTPTVLAQHNDEKYLNAESSSIPDVPVRNQRNFLVSLTVPVGYSSALGGVVYNVIPLTLEIAMHERLGLRISSPLIYYDSHFQTYSLLVTMPIYFEKSTIKQHYSGFFIGPFLAWKRDFIDNNSNRTGAGIELGHSWTVENTMQINLGVMRSTSEGMSLNLSIGKWF